MATVTVNVRDLLSTLGDFGERQLPFAASVALNDVAVRFQAAERQRMQQTMTIRRPWVLQGIKIDHGDFATKFNLAARVHVDEQRDFLNKFEIGGVKLPTTGKSIAVPILARRSKSQIVSVAQRPKAFAFQPVMTTTASGWSVYKGAQSTFMIQRPDGSGFILRRTVHHTRSGGWKGKGHLGPVRAGNDPGVDVLFVLKPRTPVSALLDFVANARQTMATQWNDAFGRAWDRAIATAR